MSASSLDYYFIIVFLQKIATSIAEIILVLGTTKSWFITTPVFIRSAYFVSGVPTDSTLVVPR